MACRCACWTTFVCTLTHFGAFCTDHWVRAVSGRVKATGTCMGRARSMYAMQCVHMQRTVYVCNTAYVYATHGVCMCNARCMYAMYSVCTCNARCVYAMHSVCMCNARFGTSRALAYTKPSNPTLQHMLCLGTTTWSVSTPCGRVLRSTKPSAPLYVHVHGMSERASHIKRGSIHFSHKDGQKMARKGQSTHTT